MWWLLAACDAPTAPVDSGLDHPEIPGHSDCLAVGEVMPEETCLALVEDDGRMPTTSFLSSDAPPATADDPRLVDPDYQWLTTEIQRCACVCCHRTSLGGPGVFQYDLDFEPVWIDSANDWVLSVMVGDTDDPIRTLPTTDPDRLRRVIEREWARRDGY